MIRFDGTFPFSIPCDLYNDGERTWIITTEDIFVAMPNGMCDFKIPKGTKSDGQTRPRFAPFAGAKIGSQYDIAWLVHDVQCVRAAKKKQWFARFMAWCKEIFQRLPRDWHEFSNAKHKDSRFALIAIWIFTALIVLWIVGFIRGYFIP